MLRVEKALADHVEVAGRHVEAIGVVRNVKLLLADELPIEAAEASAPHTGVVDVGDAGRRRARAVAAQGGQAAHAALAGQVGVDLALRVIEVLAHDELLARADHRCQGVDAQHVVGAVPAFGLEAGESGRPARQRLGLRDHGALAVGRDEVGAGIEDQVVAAHAQDVVEHRLFAGLRDREREAALVALGHEFIALAHQLGFGRVLEGAVGHLGQHARGALRLVNVEPVVGVLLQQLQGSHAELVGVLRSVLGCDAEHRLVGCEWVRAAPTGSAGVGLFVATGIGRDAAVGVARHFATGGCQGGLQCGGFCGRDRRDGGEGKGCCGQGRAQGQGGECLNSESFHGFCLIRKRSVR